MVMVAAAKYEQQLSALRRANEVRLANTRFISHVKSLGQPDGLDVIANTLVSRGFDESPTGSVSIRRLLLAVRKFGHVAATQVLRDANIISGDRRARDLSERQRAVIAAELHDRATELRERRG